VLSPFHWQAGVEGSASSFMGTYYDLSGSQVDMMRSQESAALRGTVLLPPSASDFSSTIMGVGGLDDWVGIRLRRPDSVTRKSRELGTGPGIRQPQRGGRRDVPPLLPRHKHAGGAAHRLTCSALYNRGDETLSLS